MKYLLCEYCGIPLSCYKSVPISNDANTIKKRYYKCPVCNKRIYTYEYIARKEGTKND